jgi:hypothetical protein
MTRRAIVVGRFAFLQAKGEPEKRRKDKKEQQRSKQSDTFNLASGRRYCLSATVGTQKMYRLVSDPSNDSRMLVLD